MANYCPIDSVLFEQFLQGIGFERKLSTNEVVYERRHSVESKLIIKIYTSIRVGEDVARDCGEDAIRVVGILDTGSKTYPIYKGKRVFRTTSQESVHQRVLERAREGYARFNQWLQEQRTKNDSFKFGANR